VARAEAYLHAKFHLDPSNHLATIHQRHRQTGQTGQTDRQRTDSIVQTVLQTVAQNCTPPRKPSYEVAPTTLAIFEALTINLRPWPLNLT